MKVGKCWGLLMKVMKVMTMTKLSFFINLAHEALAVAIQSRTIKPLFLEIFAENSNIDDALFNERVRVRDEEGHSDINFLDLIQQRS
ncbi:hypothetical protein D5E83_24645 [Vibrio parahaemolyticus]|nr:hypothetical protein D5E83_24645 [Vibrio parahaemolyticus]